MLNGLLEQILSSLSWMGDASLSTAPFTLTRTSFKNLAPNNCTKRFYSTCVLYWLVSIIIDYTLKNIYCCRYPVCRKPSNLRKTGPKKRWQNTCPKASSYHYGKFSLRRATEVMFSKFRGWRRKKRNCGFFETAHRAVLIDQLICDQIFWEVVFLTEFIPLQLCNTSGL